MDHRIVPPQRPRIERAEVEKTIRPHNLTVTGPVIVGYRGYYRDTMGKPGTNDRGLYDDCIVVITPTLFKTFNANTDPSRVRAGSGTGGAKGMAVLDPGLWYYRLGMHKRSYLALVQAAEVTVHRDGYAQPYSDRGWFGINIHKGSYRSTSSEGCQTIYPSQWPDFIATVQHEMEAAGVARVPYILSLWQ